MNVTRVGILSSIKICFLLCLFWSIVLALIGSVFMLLGLLIGLDIFLVLISIVVLVIGCIGFYSITGIFSGALMAVSYNFVAKRIGGLSFELEEGKNILKRIELLFSANFGAVQALIWGTIVGVGFGSFYALLLLTMGVAGTGLVSFAGGDMGAGIIGLLIFGLFAVFYFFIMVFSLMVQSAGAGFVGGLFLALVYNVIASRMSGIEANISYDTGKVESIGVLSVVKTLLVYWLFYALPEAVFFFVIGLMIGSNVGGIVEALIAGVISAVIGFIACIALCSISTAVTCVVYNLIASTVGGLSVDVE